MVQQPGGPSGFVCPDCGREAILVGGADPQFPSLLRFGPQCFNVSMGVPDLDGMYCIYCYVAKQVVGLPRLVMKVSN